MSASHSIPHHIVHKWKRKSNRRHHKSKWIRRHAHNVMVFASHSVQCTRSVLGARIRTRNRFEIIKDEWQTKVVITNSNEWCSFVQCIKLHTIFFLFSSSDNWTIRTAIVLYVSMDGTIASIRWPSLFSVIFFFILFSWFGDSGCAVWWVWWGREGGGSLQSWKG